ncbi:MAG TPA: M55 family metallopeptidase [Spirochaetales bacterium]|nr:M55 family metallopeptidase [Spirochaetales bacterium]
MRLLLSVDMEGATGVTCWDHVDPKGAEYNRFRHLLTADVNAAIEGALAGAGGSIEKVLVSDGHWNGGNVLIEELNPMAELNAGTISPFSMVEGVQEGDCDAAIFVGYHAMIGTQNAILDHTWSSRCVANVWLNGRLVGETGLNAAVCGAFGVPVLMISGDSAVCEEAKAWIPGIETAVVKWAHGRTAARCLPPSKTGALIKSAAERAVRRWVASQEAPAAPSLPAPLRVTAPVQIRVQFAFSQMADSAALLPGARRVDGRLIEFESPDMPTAYRSFRAAVSLANV